MVKSNGEENIMTYISLGRPTKDKMFKGSLTRYFWLQVFYMNQCPQAPKAPSIPLRLLWIFSKIRGDICEWIFIAGVNDTGDKLFSGVNDTADKFFFSAIKESC